MTVIRLPAGGLLLHSPVPMDVELRAELAALGPVAHHRSGGPWSSRNARETVERAFAWL